MKKLHIFIASLLAMSSVWTTAQTVHTIGDSTMADYNESTTDQRGWGQMFQQFFDETITGERVEPAAKVFMKKALIGLR